MEPPQAPRCTATLALTPCRAAPRRAVPPGCGLPAASGRLLPLMYSTPGHEGLPFSTCHPSPAQESKRETGRPPSLAQRRGRQRAGAPQAPCPGLQASAIHVPRKAPHRFRRASCFKAEPRFYMSSGHCAGRKRTPARCAGFTRRGGRRQLRGASPVESATLAAAARQLPPTPPRQTDYAHGEG
jgi:hypothetical protein